MPERFYTSAGDGKLEALEETPFPTEDELQALTALHPPRLDPVSASAGPLEIARACQKMDICLNPKNKWRFKIAKNFDVR